MPTQHTAHQAAHKQHDLLDKATAPQVFSRSLLAASGAIHGDVLERTRAATEELAAGGMDLSPWFVPEGYQIKAITDDP